MDPGFYPAMQAIYAGELDALRGLLADDPDLATRPSSGSHPTLLHLVAVDAGLGKVARPTEAARLLLEHGASAQQALLSAASTASRDVLLVLLEHGASLSAGEWRPLDEALYWSHTEFAAELRRLGAPVDRLSTAAGLGDVALIEAFFEHGALRRDAGPIGSPFGVDPALASEPGHVLAHAMITAVLNHQLAAAAALLDHGADINMKPAGFHWGGTALHAAVWRGDDGCVAWLMARGADPTVVDDSYDADALGWARHHGHDHLAELLRQA